FERNDAGIRGGPGLPPVGVEAVSGDDARDMRSVPVVVVRLRLAVDEVDEPGDALIPERIEGRRVIGEVVVPRRDTRVDHGDVHPGAGQTERLADGARADRQRRAVVEFRSGTVVMNSKDRRMLRELAEQAIRYVDDLTVDDAKFAAALV